MVKIIKESGGTAEFQPLNVTQEEQWQKAIKSAIDLFGGLDILVNNAGIESMCLVENTSLPEWRKVMEVNCDGVFLGVRQAIQTMKPGGAAGCGGSIINIASICAMVALQGAGSYSAAKAAVTQLTKMAAVECGRSSYNIRVNSIHPGVIVTELVKEGMQKSTQEGIFSSPEEAQALYESLHPIGHLGKPEDIANAVLYLASSASDFVTGAQLVVDGGFTAV